MINTNLFFNLGGFEKPQSAPVELTDAEAKPEDFAAIFTVPIFAPPIIAPIKTIEIKLAETNSVGQINQNIFAGQNSVNQIFQPKIDSAKIDFPQPNGETLVRAKKSEQTSVFENQLVPNSVGEVFKQPVIEPARAEFQIFSGEQLNGDNNFDEKIRQTLASPPPMISNFTESAENAQTNFVKFNGEQKSIAPDAPNLYSENTEKLNQTEIKAANIEIKVNTGNKFPAPSFDNFLTSVSAEFISPTEIDPPVNSVKKFFSQIPTLKADAEIIKIKSPAARLKDGKIFSGATKSTVEVSGGEISNLLKTANYLKTNFKLDFTNIQGNFESFKPKEFNEVGTISEQPELNLSIEEKPLLKSSPENILVKSSTEKSKLTLPTINEENFAAPILLNDIQKNIESDNQIKFLSAPDFISKPPILKQLFQPQFLSDNKRSLNRQTFQSSQNAKDFVVQEDSENVTDDGNSELTEVFPAIEKNLPSSLKQITINQISEDVTGENTADVAAQVSEKKSSAGKFKSSDQTEAANLLSGEKKIVEPLKQTVPGETEQIFTPNKTPENKKQNNFENNFGGRVFENFLKSAAKIPAAIESSTVSDLQKKVFAQIEPKLLELVNRTKEGVEKQVMKLRLNPEELGAVEVTVKKSDSGAISAHFHTENDAARQVLHESLDQLRNSLENAGLKIGTLEISSGLFSSNGNSSGENKQQKFGVTENQSVAAIIPDGNLNNKENDDQNRLVSLRA